MLRNKVYSVVLATLFAGSIAGCNNSNTGNAITNHQQAVVDKQSALEVGFPNIINFQEKRELKLIYELRDKTFTTITYLKGMHGHLHKMCDSVGYGIPYSTQYSNPDRIRWANNNQSNVLPQADPNGLFSAPDAAATWILCFDPKTKQVEPVYAEPDIIVSQFPLTDDTAKDSAVGKAITLTPAQIAEAVNHMGKPRT
jgi:hypothetical protein